MNCIYQFLLLIQLGIVIQTSNLEIFKEINTYISQFESDLSNNIAYVQNVMSLNKKEITEIQENYVKHGIFRQEQTPESQIKNYKQLDIVKNKVIGSEKKQEFPRNLQENSDQLDNITTFNQTFDEYLKQGPLKNPQCINNGKAILIDQTQFYCLKVRLSWEGYNTTTNNGTLNIPGCETIQRFKYACLCPRDSSGRNCEIRNYITCDIKKYQQENCLQFNSNFYNSAIDGDPPCYWVNDLSIFNQLTEIKCQNQNQTSLNETVDYDEPFEIIQSNYTIGIHSLQENNYENNNITMVNETETYKYLPIKYKISTDALVSSYEFVITPRITFPQWNSLYNSYEEYLNFNLTTNEMTMLKPVNIQFNFEKLSQKGLSAYGRFTYIQDLVLEFTTIDPNRTFDRYVCSKQPIIGFFEDIYYEEPGSVQTISKSLVAGIIILFLLVVFLFVGIIIYIRKYQEKQRLNSQLFEQRRQILENNGNLY